MALITKIEGIKDNHIYECIADYSDPELKNVNYKKGDLVYGDNIDDINECNKQFFKLIGGLNVTHKIENDNLVKIDRRPVEVGDVIFVKFARIRYKEVVVLDVLNDCQMASVYPTEIGYLPLGALVREEHRGWMGVNYNLEFNVPEKLTKSNEESLGE